MDSRISGNVFIEQVDSSLRIEAEDNILPLLETSVENGVLVIHAKKCIHPQKLLQSMQEWKKSGAFLSVDREIL